MKNFKSCPMCGFLWKNREGFLNDTNIAFVGYQVNFENLSDGLFLFNHSCKTTLALGVNAFKDMYDGPVYTKRATGADECPEYCLQKDNQEPCPSECECAFVREIIQILKKYSK